MPVSLKPLESMAESCGMVAPTTLPGDSLASVTSVGLAGPTVSFSFWPLSVALLLFESPQ